MYLQVESKFFVYLFPTNLLNYYAMKKIVIVLIALSFTFTNAQNIGLEMFGSGFTRPVVITNAGDSKLYIAEQGGLIKILNEDGTTNNTPFINLSNRLESPNTRGGEQGLLGLAFHPDYASNGYFYVYYTDADDDSVIDRYQRNASNSNIGDPNTRLELLRFSQPFRNHNGGHIAFGPDDKLYIASGDGGSGGDPGNRAQNINLLLGKLLRLDVDIPSPYIPNDNPFVGTAGADEIWAYGLRNPWKFSFDSQTDDLWIADVGQLLVEEVNKISGNPSGANYGWPCFEGDDEFDNRECPNNNADLIFPVATYTHPNSETGSVTGGYVYRGSDFPALQGKYIFGEFVTNEIGVIDTDDATGNIDWLPPFFNGGVSAFGVDQDNELYVANYGGGIIYKVIDENVLSTPDLETNAISVYPNPAEGFINIASTKKIEEIAIYDLAGNLIQQNQFDQKDINRYNTSTLATGLYILKITDTNQNKLNRKLVIK